MVSINFCLCSLLSCLHLIASCLCFETTPCNWMQNKRLTVAVASSDSHFHMIPCDVKQRCKTKSSIMLHSPIRDSLYPSSSFNIQCWKKREVDSATIRCQMEECDLFTVEAPPVNGQFNWMEPLSLSLCHDGPSLAVAYSNLCVLIQNEYAVSEGCCTTTWWFWVKQCVNIYF